LFQKIIVSKKNESASTLVQKNGWFKKITFLGMDQIREAAVGQGGLGRFNRFRKHVFLQSAVFGRDAGAAPNGFQHCALPVMVEGGGT
jgi:hypothetical protein